MPTLVSIGQKFPGGRRRGKTSIGQTDSYAVEYPRPTPLLSKDCRCERAATGCVHQQEHSGPPSSDEVIVHQPNRMYVRESTVLRVNSDGLIAMESHCEALKNLQVTYGTRQLS